MRPGKPRKVVAVGKPRLIGFFSDATATRGCGVLLSAPRDPRPRACGRGLPRPPAGMSVGGAPPQPAAGSFHLAHTKLTRSTWPSANSAIVNATPPGGAHRAEDPGRTGSPLYTLSVEMNAPS